MQQAWRILGVRLANDQFWLVLFVDMRFVLRRMTWARSCWWRFLTLWFRCAMALDRFTCLGIVLRIVLLLHRRWIKTQVVVIVDLNDQSINQPINICNLALRRSAKGSPPQEIPDRAAGGKYKCLYRFLARMHTSSSWLFVGHNVDLVSRRQGPPLIKVP